MAHSRLLDQDEVIPSIGKSPAQIEEELKIARAGIIADTELMERSAELTEGEFLLYLDRSRTIGEMDSKKWLRERLGIAGEEDAP